MHGVRLGPRRDVDHIAVGPPGVFSLNTKRLAFEATVRVTSRGFLVNGYSRDYYPRAVEEAQAVSSRLRAATGVPVTVHPLVTVKEQPADVTVLPRRHLCAWLEEQRQVLAWDAVKHLGEAVRRPSAWDPTKVAMVLDHVPEAASGPAVTDAVASPAAEGRAPRQVLKVVEWRRYGHHRRYVNDAETGDSIGWRDERTGEVHVEEGVDPRVVREALEHGTEVRPG